MTRLGATLALAIATACTGNLLSHTSAQALTSSQGSAGTSVAGSTGAGPTPLQRLTSAEYTNTVVDILQLPQLPNIALPADETGGTFAVNTGAVIDSLTLQEYLDAATAITAATDTNMLLGCKANESQSDCSARFVTTMGRRLMRRPLTDDEVTTYQQLMAKMGATDIQAGARSMIQTMLISPYFLYKVEVESQSVATPISAIELATRLSYALWGSAPDDTLLDSAVSGALLSNDELQRQATRMMADARFKNGLRNFVLQWLSLTQLPNAAKDATLFPSYNPNLVTAMLNETVDFSTWVVQTRNGSLHDLMTQSSSPISGPLYALYGLPAPSTDQNVQLVALDANQRAGILTLSAFLAAQAHANQSAPVLRGKTVMTQVLCRNIPPPPVNVSIAVPAVTSGTTTRERLTAHVTNPACATCHQLFDPAGFGFENFDAIGVWRTTEGGQPVDASGTFTDSANKTHTFSTPVELANALVASADLAP